ncbi:hypothetical protein [Crassaminicella profunda]|uniref:hypothetical protein n=1 Tax=Crassaminicella profunda TaxID=1286698 RepID=UPI001CA60C93|nr:hypothetical protein [Crassaminicella profunda]QZY54220.1 hypothetical protein K7H06_14370 [Crassaminicella profunda]
MKNQKIVDCIIQKKFKEILTANKKGKLYDFKKELKKELETTLEKLHNPDQKKEIETILYEMKNHQNSTNWTH